MKMGICDFLFKDELENVVAIKLANRINKYFYKKYGENVRFMKPLFIKFPQYISIGDDVTIRSGIRLEPIKEWKGKRFNPELVIKSGVTLEQNCHIVCAKKLIIESGVLISSYVFITDCEHSYVDCRYGISKQRLIAKETIIGRDSFIGTGAKILAGVSIGKHCVIGANSVVNRDIPDFSVAAGVPAKIIKKYDEIEEKWKFVHEK